MGSNGKTEDNVPELTDLFYLPTLPDAHSSYGESRYVVFGVPFDNTSSYRRGSRLAPDSIRHAYNNLESFDPWYNVNFPDISICDLGNLEVGEDAEEVIDTVQQVGSRLYRDGKIPIMLGGEHSLTSGMVRNLPDAYMVIIDAHSDFRDTYMGSKFNHACITRRCLEILGKDRIWSVGTRSTSQEEKESGIMDQVSFYSARFVKKHGIGEVLDQIRERISGPVYFSIDMDGFDPSFAPGVGTPEPYGLSDTDVRALINGLGKKIISFDIVEMTPVYDNGNTSMLAAKLIQDFIGSREGTLEE